MKYRKDWSSHLPLLLEILNIADGPILELGTGLFSTPVLHWLCEVQGKHLVSYESVERYYKWNQTFSTPNHEIIKVEDWDKALIDQKWGLAFIDHEPAERRITDIKRLANLAEYVVVHDTQDKNEHEYNYSEIYPLFKFRRDSKQHPRTSVLSNFHDVNKLHHSELE